ncbi:Cupredoxin-like domain-containing protein [Methylocella tundrae]|uniref:Cupredoxin-like domain-containing protein n=1 Tax=Methylocella tundrae TaxID=227605 RepID=A0A4U8Z106_METTU|nr:Cupredoxin-like domain-containing protein [Methylocella tundrae]
MSASGLKARRVSMEGKSLKNVATLWLVLSLLLIGAPLSADEEPTFTLEFHDGKVAPLRVEVPANTRFKLELRNTGDTPAEFESAELRKEKVLAPNSTSILVFRTLDPGEYQFFDDFHPDAPKAVIIAK